MLGVFCVVFLPLAYVVVKLATRKTRVSGLTYGPGVIPLHHAFDFHDWAMLNDALFEPVDHPDADKETSPLLGPRTSVQFGYRYDYASNSIQKWPARLPHVLGALQAIAVERAGVAPNYFNQCIVNKYLPGQSILPHIDHPGFGEVIACFSLMAKYSEAAPVPVVFSRGDQRVELLVADCSLYIMRGEARHEWTHGLTPSRNLRYSVTFRHVDELKNFR